MVGGPRCFCAISHRNRVGTSSPHFGDRSIRLAIFIPDELAPIRGMDSGPDFRDCQPSTSPGMLHFVQHDIRVAEAPVTHVTGDCHPQRRNFRLPGHSLTGGWRVIRNPGKHCGVISEDRRLRRRWATDGVACAFRRLLPSHPTPSAACPYTTLHEPSEFRISRRLSP